MTLPLYANTSGSILQTAPELGLVSAQLLEEIDAAPALQSVDDRFGGRVFDEREPKYDGNQDAIIPLYDKPEVRTLLEQGGLRFERRVSEPTHTPYFASFVPDPERALACSQANDIPIRFVGEVSENGDTPAEVLEQILQAGFHPVSVASREYYAHDLRGYDHFLGVIAGGKPLIEWIVRYAPEADASMNLAEVYDRATSGITEILDTLFSRHGNPSIAIRSVLNLFKDRDHSTKSQLSGPMDTTDQARDLELRTILYEGLKRNGIHQPDLMPSRWQQLGRQALWALRRR